MFHILFECMFYVETETASVCYEFHFPLWFIVLIIFSWEKFIVLRCVTSCQNKFLIYILLLTYILIYDLGTELVAVYSYSDLIHIYVNKFHKIYLINSVFILHLHIMYEHMIHPSPNEPDHFAFVLVKECSLSSSRTYQTDVYHIIITYVSAWSGVSAFRFTAHIHTRL